jgi:hypothetical protein
MDQIDRAAQVTGWQRDVLEHLFQVAQEQTELSFQDFIAAHMGQSAFFLAACQGLGLEKCLMAQEIGLEVFDYDCSQPHSLV